MHIQRSQLEELARFLGPPIEADFGEVPMRQGEFALVAGSADKGRAHDVTVFIEKDGKFVCIQKHAYAGTGIYRAPSGGVEPGESILEGAVREAFEETGLEARPVAYPLLVKARFVERESGRSVGWTSIVLQAVAAGGNMGTRDPREIYAVGELTREALLGEVTEKMLASGSGGLSYRARLTRAFFEAVDRERTGRTAGAAKG